MDNLKIIESLLEKRWDTKQGLVWYPLAGILFAGLAILGLERVGIVLPQFWVSVFLALVFVCFLASWLFRRYWPNNPRKLLVAFAVTTRDKESERRYRQIQHNISKIVNENNLNELLTIRFLPADITFSSGKRAEKYLREKCINVLVWGTAEQGTVSGDDLVKFTPSISYEYNTIASNTPEEIKRISPAVPLLIPKTNSLPTLEFVSTNMFEMSLSILVMCLFSSLTIKDTHKLVPLLEELGARLERKPDNTEHIAWQALRNKVEELTKKTYERLVEYNYNDRRNLKEAGRYTTKLLNRWPNDFFANQNAAIFEYLKGDIVTARQHISRAIVADPRSPLPTISLAFLNLVEGKYNKALECYRKLHNKELNKTNNLRTAEFMLTEYEKTNNKALLFGAGWLNTKYVDQAFGHGLLVEFIDQTSDNDGYRLLVNEANRIINENN